MATKTVLATNGKANSYELKPFSYELKPFSYQMATKTVVAILNLICSEKKTERRREKGKEKENKKLIINGVDGSFTSMAWVFLMKMEAIAIGQ